jgi:hypothetical protein
LQSVIDALTRNQAQNAPAQLPASVDVPSTTSYTDAGQSVQLPTPIGPIGITGLNGQKLLPVFLAAAIIGGALLYNKKRKGR